MIFSLPDDLSAFCNYLFNNFHRVLFVLNCVVQIVLARAVWLNGKERSARGGETAFVGRHLWTLIVLVTGLFGLLVYWLLHDSRLRAKR